jgi:hypothetical protein
VSKGAAHIPDKIYCNASSLVFQYIFIRKAPQVLSGYKLLLCKLACDSDSLYPEKSAQHLLTL